MDATFWKAQYYGCNIMDATFRMQHLNAKFWMQNIGCNNLNALTWMQLSGYWQCVLCPWQP